MHIAISLVKDFLYEHVDLITLLFVLALIIFSEELQPCIIILPNI